MRHMICHETLTFSGKDDEVEKEEAFPLGKSDVCRAKLEVYTATGALVKVTIAPDTVSSVVMASRPLLHGLHSSNSGTITTSGGSNSLSERGYLIIPHKVRGSAIVPGFAADKASLPGNCSVLLSKRANSSLQVSTDAHCDIEVTPGAEEPDLMFRAKPIGGPLTHTITGKDGVEHMCRIDSDFSWGRPTDPRPTVLVGRDDMVVVQWSDGTHSLLRDKWLVPIKGAESTHATEAVEKESSAGSDTEPATKVACPTDNVAVAVIAAKMVALVHNGNSFWFPMGKVAAGETPAKAAVRILQEQAGISEGEIPSELTVAGEYVDADGLRTVMYIISADNPKHVVLRHRNSDQWFTDKSWAPRWAPVEMVIENVRDDHVDSSGEGTSRRWLPLRHNHMSKVELGCLTKALEKAKTATQGVFATETREIDGWLSGTAEAFATAVAGMHQRGEGVDGVCVNP